MSNYLCASTKSNFLLSEQYLLCNPTLILPRLMHSSPALIPFVFLQFSTHISPFLSLPNESSAILKEFNTFTSALTILIFSYVRNLCAFSLALIVCFPDALSPAVLEALKTVNPAIESLVLKGAAIYLAVCHNTKTKETFLSLVFHFTKTMWFALVEISSYFHLDFLWVNGEGVLDWNIYCTKSEILAIDFWKGR